MKISHPRSAPVNGVRAHGVARPALFITGAIGVSEQRTQQLAMIPCRTASAQHRYARRPIGITGASTTRKTRRRKPTELRSRFHPLAVPKEKGLPEYCVDLGLVQINQISDNRVGEF